jgi:hypothetical protein
LTPDFAIAIPQVKIKAMSARCSIKRHPSPRDSDAS